LLYILIDYFSSLISFAFYPVCSPQEKTKYYDGVFTVLLRMSRVALPTGMSIAVILFWIVVVCIVVFVILPFLGYALISDYDNSGCLGVIRKLIGFPLFLIGFGSCFWGCLSVSMFPLSAIPCCGGLLVGMLGYWLCDFDSLPPKEEWDFKD
jgi:hypothetical protein